MHQQLSRRQTCNIDSLSEQVIFYVFILKTRRLRAGACRGLVNEHQRRLRLLSSFPSCRSGTQGGGGGFGCLPEISSTRNQPFPKEATEALPLTGPRRAGGEPAAGDASEMMNFPPDVHAGSVTTQVHAPRLLCHAALLWGSALNIKGCFVLFYTCSTNLAASWRNDEVPPSTPSF